MTQSHTKELFVIGNPVKHSKSPLIHTSWFEKYNIDARYQTNEILENKFAADIDTLKKTAFGWNITAPYKKQIIHEIDTLTPNAKALGAVNTVYKDPNGAFIGDNTDVIGVEKSLAHYFLQTQTKPTPDFWHDKKALVIGAGGAARAACQALKNMGVHSISITNRTLVTAQELANAFGLHTVIPWEDVNNHLSEFNVICQMSSVGLKNETRLPFDFSKLKQSCICFDAVYNPLETDFLKRARNQGATYIDGLWMLLYQAAAAFEIWFGITPEIDSKLRNKLLA